MIFEYAVLNSFQRYLFHKHKVVSINMTQHRSLDKMSFSYVSSAETTAITD